MSCEKRHTRKQIAVLEGPCGCVVVLFDCGCQYLDRPCNYLVGTMSVDFDTTQLVEKHIEELILRRPLLEELRNARGFRDGP